MIFCETKEKGSGGVPRYCFFTTAKKRPVLGNSGCHLERDRYTATLLCLLCRLFFFLFGPSRSPQAKEFSYVYLRNSSCPEPRSEGWSWCYCPSGLDSGKKLAELRQTGSPSLWRIVIRAYFIIQARSGGGFGRRRSFRGTFGHLIGYSSFFHAVDSRRSAVCM